MNQETIGYLGRRTAQLAIGNSTLRNQGAPGVAKAARDFLANVDIKSFSVNSACSTDSSRVGSRTTAESYAGHGALPDALAPLSWD